MRRNALASAATAGASLNKTCRLAAPSGPTHSIRSAFSRQVSGRGATTRFSSRPGLECSVPRDSNGALSQGDSRVS